jgi:hypothetical protein
MSIFDRLSRVRPGSLRALNSAIRTVFQQDLFSAEELDILKESKSGPRRARIKTQLELRFSDLDKLNKVYFLLLKGKLLHVLFFVVAAGILALGISYFIFRELPRAYTIGHNIRLRPVDNPSAAAITLNLYILPSSAGNEEPVESMLYTGNEGDQANLTTDRFWEWLLGSSDRYQVDTSAIMTDPKVQEDYRFFFSEFIDMTDTIQAAAVNLFSIEARKMIYQYINSDSNYVGSTLAASAALTEMQGVGARRSYNSEFHPRCLLPFFIQEVKEADLKIYYISIRKNSYRQNIVLVQSDPLCQSSCLTKIRFKYGNSTNNAITEDRDLRWVDLNSSCKRFDNPHYYSTGDDCFLLDGLSDNPKEVYSVKQKKLR